MDHSYCFSSPQPYHDFVQIQPISSLDDLGTSLAPHDGITVKPVRGDSGTSEVDDDLISSQSRQRAQRKVQNRAAQQAFRKRKEMHVKDLETKIASLEAAQQQILVENEHLKQKLHQISNENERLRALSQISSEDLYSLDPPTFNTAKFYPNFLADQYAKNPSRSIITRDGERLLDAGAAWDFIINHQLFKKGLVDIGDLSERLKLCARYDNHSLALSERSIIAAIEQSVASRTDDLL
ncbi:AP-1-like transcription factor [Fusarium solani]|uniref:uncharacterized protein n=1 Tax=Fusarium solani TaxID=169388 RepID=UPI0032C46EAA|nr:hypothetical protein MRS44_013663 [Fusarium solani]